jgi:glycosyltransferase involved in cell wall biosynthesis
MIRISAVIITFNEQDHIERCLQSLLWADEIVVVDSGSTDQTPAICRKYRVRLLEHPWEGFVRQKIFATAAAANDWIFSIDGDEEVSESLRQEIERIKASTPQAAAFRMPRKMFYLGKWIKHGSWYPDYKIRLFNRQQGRWAGLEVHEYWQPAGRCEKLGGDLLHYSYKNLADHLHKMNNLTTQAAREMQQKGVKPYLRNILGRPCGKFLKSYFIQAGFLDGFTGLIIALLGSYYVLLKYLKLWELQRSLKQ